MVTRRSASKTDDFFPNVNNDDKDDVETNDRFLVGDAEKLVFKTVSIPSRTWSKFLSSRFDFDPGDDVSNSFSSSSGYIS